MNQPLAMPSREAIAAIHADINSALAGVAAKHGLQAIKTGTLRYDASGFRVTVESLFAGAESQEMRDLRTNAGLFGFTPEIAGATIEYGGQPYEVVGVRRTKLDLKSVTNGKLYAAPITQVHAALLSQKSNLGLLRGR